MLPLSLWFLLPADTANASPIPFPLVLDSGRWWGGAIASFVGAGVAWKLAAWVYLDFLRPRLDRFVSDARRRRPQDEDEIRLESRARMSDREDRLIIATFRRIAPEHDQIVLGAVERNPAEFRQLLRDTVLREDFETARKRDEAASRALAVAEACSTALEGISAAQLAQGEALRELPRISGVMESFSGIVQRMDGTLREVNVRLEDMAREQGRAAGAIEEMRRSYGGPEHRDPTPGRRAEDRARMAVVLASEDGTDPERR